MWRRISAFVIPTLLAVGILVYMLYQVRESLPEALHLLRPAFLLLAVLICVISWILRGVRYRIILQGLSISTTGFYATACILISQTANLIVPARLGDLVRMFILKDEKTATYSQGLSSIVVERVFDVVMVALLGFLSIHFVFNVPGWFYTLITVPLVGGGIFFLLLYTMGMLQSDNRYIAIILTMVREIRQASLNARSLASLSLLSIGIWLLDVAVCLVVIEMFQVPLPLPVVILAIAIGNLVKAVPLTPGGIGTYEAALAITFSLSGLAPVTATLIAILDHLIKNVVTFIGGIVSIYVFGRWVVTLMWRALRVKMGEDESIGH